MFLKFEKSFIVLKNHFKYFLDKHLIKIPLKTLPQKNNTSFKNTINRNTVKHTLKKHWRVFLLKTLKNIFTWMFLVEVFSQKMLLEESLIKYIYIYISKHYR